MNTLGVTDYYGTKFFGKIDVSSGRPFDEKKTVFDKKIFIFYFSQMTLHGFILYLQAFRMHGI